MRLQPLGHLSAARTAKTGAVNGDHLVDPNENAKTFLAFFADFRTAIRNNIAKRRADAYLNGYNGCSQTGQRQHEAPMIRAILRLLSSIALATAVIMAVLDATRSIAAEQVVFTSLGQFWATVSRPSLEAAQDAFLTSLPALFWDPLMIGFLQQPGFAVFAVLALLLALAGRRTQQRRQFAH